MERHLHRAGLVGYAVLGVQHLELTGIACTIGQGPDLSDVVVVHVYDAGALRHFIGHGESDVDVIVANPCFRIRCEHLLQVFLAVYGDGIGRIFIGCHRDGRLRHTVPPDTAFVDVLCRRQQFFAAFLLHTGQGRIDRQPVNAPAVDEIAPERHLRGVVRLMLIVQFQLRQTAMGVAIGDDADDLRVVAGLVCNIFDARAGTDRLRHALCCRADAVGRDFLDRAAGRLEIEVGIGLGTDNAVHAEIGHFIAAVGDVHLAQRTADGAAGGKSGGGEHPKRHHQHKEHGNQSFFQGHTSNLLCCCSDHPSVRGLIHDAGVQSQAVLIRSTGSAGIGVQHLGNAADRVAFGAELRRIGDDVSCFQRMDLTKMIGNASVMPRKADISVPYARF